MYEQILASDLKIYFVYLDLKIGSMRRAHEITAFMQLQQNAIPLGLKFELD